MTYRNTQSSYVFLVVGLVALAAAGISVALDDEPSSRALITWAVLAVVVFVLAVFSRLTVMVGAGTVLAQFGPGWPSRRIDLREVVEVTIERTRWWEGTGVRKIRDGWMYNVWGHDAVQLRLSSGRVFRIGTDDAERLLLAVRVELERLA